MDRSSDRLYSLAAKLQLLLPGFCWSNAEAVAGMLQYRSLYDSYTE